MPKLFVFAIGGTGSRVLKSLTMLLASGVEIPNTEKIIPIIIDPDRSNGDLSRTQEILKLYKSIRRKSFSERSSFFKTEISSLDELGDGSNYSDNFTFEIDGVNGHLFREYIGFADLDDNNKAFTSLLFSKKNLDSDMEIGFKGNPNIGSVVLNKFKYSTFFQKFASNFEEDDRIYIISSIFGGTGAAGFPLLVKNIREASVDLSNSHYLRNGKIGAVTVLPYFGIDRTSGSTINSDTFISKTIAALKYYAENISANRSINALYYIGDYTSNEQAGADGATDQKNNAHFVELAAALAIKDFMTYNDQELNVTDGRADNPLHFEFGLGKETTSIVSTHLAHQTYNEIMKELTQFSLFRNYLVHHYEEAVSNPKMAHIYDGTNKLSKQAIDQRFMENLKLYLNHFTAWLTEMKKSNVSFNVINLDHIGKSIFNLVNGKEIKQGFFGKILGSSGIEKYYHELNTNENKFDNLTSDQKLMSLHSEVTRNIVDEIIKL